jgi:lipopolysaccharide export system permease protein
MIVMRASGSSPLRLATPAIKTGVLLAGFLLVLSLWVSPLGISNVQVLKKQAQAEYGHLLFREGVFNSVGKNLTAYVRTKSPDGQLTGLLVHDTRDGKAVTVIARSGQIISDDAGQKMIVYDGSRQEEDKITNKFSRLDFKQYTLEIPSTVSDTSERWRKPDERTFNELTHALKTESESARDLKEFRSELHRRFTTPILMVSFVVLAAAFLLQGGFARDGQIRLMIMAAITALFFQGIYLLVYNMAKESMLGCVLLYVSALTPLALGVFFLTPLGEKIMINVMVVASHIRKTIP